MYRKCETCKDKGKACHQKQIERSERNLEIFHRWEEPWCVCWESDEKKDDKDKKKGWF